MVIGKRKRTPNDAQWCLDNIDNLSLKCFATNFSLTDRKYAGTRYRNIVSKYAPAGHRERLLEEMVVWNRSVGVAEFWVEMKRKAILPTSKPSQDHLPIPPFQNNYGRTNGSTNNNSNNNNNDSTNDSNEWIFDGSNVSDLFREYQQKIKTQVAEKGSFRAESDLQEILALSNILFLALNHHSDLKVEIFGCQLVDSLCHAASNRFMDNVEPDFSTQELSDLATIINDIQTGRKSTVDAQLDLLLKAKTMGPAKAAVARGIAYLVVKLPTREIIDMDSLGETELQSTYIDPLLTSLFSNPQENVVLRWSNKNEKVSNIRPDAIISTLIQAKHGHPLGFGEVKPGNSSTNKHSFCMDTLRLAILSRDAIDCYSHDVCFAFQVNGYRVSFFMVYRQHQDLYVMVEIATLTFPRSLDNLDELATIKNLSTLARASSSFWSNCTAPSKSPMSPSSQMPIGALYQLINKFHSKDIGTTSRY